MHDPVDSVRVSGARMAPQHSHRDQGRGDRLVAAREALNRSPDEMAVNFDVDVRELLAWESGAELPSDLSDEALERAYREPARWLRYGDDDIGTRIARLRLGIGWTQVELAREVGAGVQDKRESRSAAISRTVQTWEAGRMPSPRFHEALELKLGTTIEYLRDGIGPAKASRREESMDPAKMLERLRALEARVARLPIERRQSRGMDDLTRVENRVTELAEGQSVQAGLIRELTDDLRDLQQARDDLATLVADLQRQLREGQG